MNNPFTTGRAPPTPPPPEPEVVDAEWEDAPANNVTPNVTLRQSLGLLTDGEVAGALGQQVRTLKHWRTLKTGPPYVKVGREVFYLYEDVRNWLYTQREDTMSEQKRDYRKNTDEAQTTQAPPVPDEKVPVPTPEVIPGTPSDPPATEGGEGAGEAA